MYRAITLIELLTTLTIMVIAIYLISSPLFYLQDYIALNAEIENIKSFFYQLQIKANYTQKGYSISISQHQTDKKWCIIAIEKEDNTSYYCDCFHLPHCKIPQGYILYQNQYESIVRNNKLFEVFTNIERNSISSSEKCLKVSVNNLHRVIQLDKLGMINVAHQHKRSLCKSI